MKIKSGFAKREIAGSNIVVPVGKNAVSFNAMITLNETGSFLWDAFQHDITVDDAVRLITAEYDVSPERAKADIEKFVSLLKDNSIME
ncbi:MAG: PqqD family protein [Ruminococcaceae bacterium]|nr:PqqD family protein [Oscillospiraceae bacterium]